jgi:hypothetical protein
MLQLLPLDVGCGWLDVGCFPNSRRPHPHRLRAVHCCGVSDIVEPYPEWCAFKKQLTGNEWDYDSRRLFYRWTPDMTREKFRPWVEIATGTRPAAGSLPGTFGWPPTAAHT